MGELIRELEGGNGASEPPVALQFELVENRPGGSKQRAKPGIQVRPVVRGASSNWVRSGIAWSRLDHSFQFRSLSADQRRILNELLSVQRLSALYDGRYS
ncbi:MAG: hypothetical protein ACRDYY_07475 [Acidimicrobiales bacterium]